MSAVDFFKMKKKRYNRLKALAEQLQKKLQKLGINIEFDYKFILSNYNGSFNKSTIWINIPTSEVGVFLSLGKELTLFRLWDEESIQNVFFNLENCSSRNDVLKLIRATGTLSIIKCSQF